MTVLIGGEEMSQLWLTPIALTVGLVLYWWLVGWPSGILGGAGDPTPSKVTFYLIGYAITLVGVILGAGFRRVLRLQSQGPGVINPRRLMTSVFRSSDLWLG